MQASVSWDEHIEETLDHSSQTEWVQFECYSETVVGFIGNEATKPNPTADNAIIETENCFVGISFAAQVSTLQNDL